MSGYCSCACRDCFEIAISGDEPKALCSDCEAADCDPDGGECQSPSAYEQDEESANE